MKERILRLALADPKDGKPETTLLAYEYDAAGNLIQATDLYRGLLAPESGRADEVDAAEALVERRADEAEVVGRQLLVARAADDVPVRRHAGERRDAAAE